MDKCIMYGHTACVHKNYMKMKKLFLTTLLIIVAVLASAQTVQKT